MGGSSGKLIYEVMKKVYQQPITETLKMEPNSILCASLFIDPNEGSGGGW